MKRIFLSLALAVVTALTFSSCDNAKDKPVNPEGVQVSAGLKTALMKQGFKFDANGALIVDARVTGTKELDLSGTNIKDFNGLSAFPNLKSLVLRNNGYYPLFDFSKLPNNVDAVDLRDNNIFVYNGLVSTKVAENGDETNTILHKLKKLYLPNGAKDNLSSILNFYLENKEAVDNGNIDMQMQKKDGSLEKYTTMRDVPDEALKTYLKREFSDIFVGDKIDISRRFGQEQSKKSFMPSDEDYGPTHEGSYRIEDFDGAQYVINNKSYKPSQIFITTSADKAKLPYIKVPEDCNLFGLEYGDLSNSYLDFSEVKTLGGCLLSQLTGLKTLDLSHSGIGIKGINLQLLGLTDLEECKFLDNISKLGTFLVLNTPKLKTLDLSKADSLKSIQLAGLSPDIDLKLPTELGDRIIELGVPEDVYSMPYVHKWIFDNHEHLVENRIDDFTASDAGLDLPFFSWDYAYKVETGEIKIPTTRGLFTYPTYYYSGEIYNLNMNGKTGYQNRPLTCTVIDQNGYNYIIKAKLPRIGRMPGTLFLEFAIKKDRNGKFILDTSYNDGKVAMLRLLRGMVTVDIYPEGTPEEALKVEDFDRNNLKFTIKCHGEYNSKDFFAHVSFKK